MLPTTILAVALFGASSLAGPIFCTDAEHPMDSTVHKSVTKSCCGGNSFSTSNFLCDTGSKPTTSFCSCCQGSNLACMNVGG
ncbi:hypothetical protein CGMCC3_g13676 [Colletotrichum fructicola]|nr:uncharacterized protein CGMCC3_g13676 [Colletotrichum fructicola]KAE9570162.1 hypothetical protein CGMCC3_g13676 [Colletotrichum fructicola]